MRLTFTNNHETEVCLTEARNRFHEVIEIRAARSEIERVAEESGNWQVGQQLIKNCMMKDSRIRLKGKGLKKFKSLLV
jgi:hypothetical protein